MRSAIRPVNSILSWSRPLHQSWLEGHSAPRLAEICDGIDLIAYFADPAEIQREVVRLRRLLPSLDTVTSCVMPTPPFVRSAEELAGAVGLMQSFGIERFESAGINRLGEGDENALRRRISDPR